MTDDRASAVEPPVVVDASVWIAALTRDEPVHMTSARFLATAMAGGAPVVLPVLTRVEIACAIARRRGGDTADRALGQLDALPGIARLAADRIDPDAALTCGVRMRLRTLDSFLVAATIATGARLVTWDAELLERAGAITPTEWLEAHALRTS